MQPHVTCGIDFGTSNSSLAVATHQGVRLIELEGRKRTMPSAMFFIGKNNQAHFGSEAVRMFLAGARGRLMRSLKRVLGTAIMKQGTLVNGRVLKFDAIIAAYIANLKQMAEAQTGTEISSVVMGRPVYFVDGDAAANQRAQEELTAILKSCGFSTIQFQFEPIAAAYAHEVGLKAEKLALVADIGGGTSDFSVIRLSGKSLGKAQRASDILSNEGIRVGGNDLDKSLSLAAFMPALGYQTTYGEKNLRMPLKPFYDLSEWSKVNFLYTTKIMRQTEQLYRQAHEQHKYKRFLQVLANEKGHALLQEVENTKIQLTNQQLATVSLSFLEQGFSLSVQKEAFEQAINQHVQSIANTAMACVQQAAVRPEQIELLILTGGSTEVPVIQNAFKGLFPNAQVSDKNKLSSVALGLAHDGLRKFG